MKRFLSLLALVALPSVGFATDAQTPRKTNITAADKMKECCSCGPTSAMEETWADRSFLKVGFTKSNSAFYSLNTIQPLYRDASMDNTLFIQAGIGMEKWHRSTGDVGLGYRYLTQSGSNMFGVSLFYFDNTRTHHHQQLDLMKKNGLGLDLSWYTKYTTLSLGRYEHVRKMNHQKTWSNLVNFHKELTTLDLSFQIPYLPWTEFTIGKEWHHRHHHHNHFSNFDYALTLNIAGPLAVEMGYRHNEGRKKKHGFVNFIVNFGRPAVREHTLADAFLGDEAFTPRDLKNYTLDPVARAVI